MSLGSLLNTKSHEFSFFMCLPNQNVIIDLCFKFNYASKFLSFYIINSFSKPYRYFWLATVHTHLLSLVIVYQHVINGHHPLVPQGNNCSSSWHIATYSTNSKVYIYLNLTTNKAIQKASKLKMTNTTMMDLEVSFWG